jgi:hypothetical protein
MIEAWGMVPGMTVPAAEDPDRLALPETLVGQGSLFALLLSGD